jgi:Predicted flavin-nucleotide-binding protein
MNTFSTHKDVTWLPETMSLDQQAEMTQSEVDRVLTSRETAVLSLARDNKPYAIPISYGYDTDTRIFAFRLVSTPDSEKRQYLGSQPSGRLVVYTEDSPKYESVVASGAIEEIPREELTPARVKQYGGAKRPLFEMWAADPDALNIGLYELDPTELTGRQIRINEE